MRKFAQTGTALALLVGVYLAIAAVAPAGAQTPWTPASGEPPGAYRPVLDTSELFQKFEGALTIGTAGGARTELSASRVAVFDSQGKGGALSSVAGSLILAPAGDGGVAFSTASVVLPVIPSLEELNGLVVPGTEKGPGSPAGLLVYYQPEKELKFFDGFAWWGIGEAVVNPKPYFVKLVLSKNLPNTRFGSEAPTYPVPGIEVHAPVRGVWDGTGTKELLVPVGSTVKLWARNARVGGNWGDRCRRFLYWERTGPCGADRPTATNRSCEFLVTPLETDNPEAETVRSAPIEIRGEWDGAETVVPGCANGETKMVKL